MREREYLSETPAITGTYHSPDEWDEVLQRFYKGETVKAYDRYGYENLEKREAEVAKLVGIEKGNLLLYNSGMAAITESLESLHLTKGDVLLYSQSVYGESKELIERDLASRGVKCVPIFSGKIEEVKKLIDRYHPKAIFTETVGNAPDMPTVDLDALFKKVEEINDKYEKDLSLTKILKKQLTRKTGLKEEKLNQLVKLFEQTARKVNQIHSYMPLRLLVRELEKEKIDIGNRRITLLELKSMIDSAWLAKREKPITVVLDNTIPTESSLDLSREIKKTKTPVLVANSGTKFFAMDLGTMGIVYSNSPEKILELKLRRMSTGTYLPPAVETILPERNKEEFDLRNKQVLQNTKALAQSFAKLVDRGIGIKAVSHPNLPTHPNYEYANKHMPDGASVVFYIECDDAKKVARKLHEKIAGMVEYGGSFGFEKTRIAWFSDSLIRVAGGNESPEELQKLLEAIESVE